MAAPGSTGPTAPLEVLALSAEARAEQELVERLLAGGLP